MLELLIEKHIVCRNIQTLFISVSDECVNVIRAYTNKFTRVRRQNSSFGHSRDHNSLFP